MGIEKIARMNMPKEQKERETLSLKDLLEELKVIVATKGKKEIN